MDSFEWNKVAASVLVAVLLIMGLFAGLVGTLARPDDRAVLRVYGWDDLAERAEPVFLEETNEDDHTYQGRLF